MLLPQEYTHPQKTYVAYLTTSQYVPGVQSQWYAYSRNAPRDLTYSALVVQIVGGPGDSGYNDSSALTYPSDMYTHEFTDITINPDTGVLILTSAQIQSIDKHYNNYIMLFPKIPTRFPYFSDDVTLSTEANYKTLIPPNNYGRTGPNKVYPLSTPVNGYKYLFENGLNPDPGGEIASNTVQQVTTISGYPITKDNLGYGFFNLVVPYFNGPWHLMYIYGDDLTTLYLGTIQRDPYIATSYGIYHNKITDELFTPWGEGVNFWDTPIYYDNYFGIYKIDISRYRHNINNHIPAVIRNNMNIEIDNPEAGVTTQQAVQLYGLSYATDQLPGVKYLIPGDPWGMDMDYSGNIYMALGNGKIIKLSGDSMTVLYDGLMEPWNVTVIDKQSSNPHLLIPATRGGTVNLLYPDGKMETICGTPLLPYQEGWDKPIEDSSQHHHGTFGCPTAIVIDEEDYSLLVGDETGMAIRRIRSPKLQRMIGYLKNPAPHSPDHTKFPTDFVVLVVCILFILINSF
jgi:hypothetical protein